jgi:hypothetical protein
MYVHYCIGLFNNFLRSAVTNDKTNFSDEVEKTWPLQDVPLIHWTKQTSWASSTLSFEYRTTKTPHCYITGQNDAINILLVKLGLVCPFSQCIGLHVLKPNICYSPAMTILSCLSYSVMNRSAWKLNNELRCKRLNKQSLLNLFDHLGVLCSVQKK